MIALIQRVTQAKVEVGGEVVGQIGKGLLVLLGVEKDDDRAKADKLVEKVLNYRVFSDENEFERATSGWRSLGGVAIYVGGGYPKRASPKLFQRRNTIASKRTL